MFGNLKIKRMSQKLKELYSQEHELSQRYEEALSAGEDAENINNSLKVLAGTIADFIENEYAFAVYERYCKSKPNLIRVKTGEVVSWDEGFGSDFDKISKSLRHSLVGLVEEPGRYKLV